MSVEATKWAWEQDVKGAKKLVLLALADHAGEHEDREGLWAWPSVSRIETMTGLSRSGVEGAVRELVAISLVERHERKRANNSRTSNHYRLCTAPSPAGGPPLSEGPPLHGEGPEPSLELPGLEGSKKPPTESKNLGGQADPVRAVWLTYVEVMQPRDKALHDAERKLIREALKVATVEECQRAIRGCGASAWHMGDNPSRKKYNRLSQILKGKQGVRTLREQIDFMLDLADKGGVGEASASSDTGSVDPAKLERMRRSIWRAFDMPDSNVAREQAEKAEAWLVEHGWVVIRKDDERPKIERKPS